MGELAARFPHNSNKPLEKPDGPCGPSPAAPNRATDRHRQHRQRDERTDKVGSGKPQVGFNPGNGPLDRVRVDSSGRALTTNQGVFIADNQNSLKAGLRGPTLLEDFILREKITHFDHERIPERIVHARGSAAHSYFECYD
jgi:catalase